MSSLRRSARLASKYGLQTQEPEQASQELIQKQAKDIQEMMHLYSPNTHTSTQIWCIAKIFQKTATCKEMLLNSPTLREVILERMEDFDSKIALYRLSNMFPEECKEYAKASAAIRSILS